MAGKPTIEIKYEQLRDELRTGALWEFLPDVIKTRATNCLVKERDLTIDSDEVWALHVRMQDALEELSPLLEATL